MAEDFNESGENKFDEKMSGGRKGRAKKAGSDDSRKKSGKKRNIREELERNAQQVNRLPGLLEQLRQDILKIRREVRFDKYPPQITVDEDGDVCVDIPEKFYENETAETDDLKLIGEIRLYDDPFIPITFDFYYDDE